MSSQLQVFILGMHCAIELNLELTVTEIEAIYHNIYHNLFSFFNKYFHSDIVICPHVPQQKSVMHSEIYYGLRIF